MLKKAIFKKFILVFIVIALLFGFICPKQVNAKVFDDMQAGALRILYWIPKSILKLANNLMCDDNHQFVDGEDSGEIELYLTAESIIKGKFILINPNIFEEGYSSQYYDQNKESVTGGRNELRNTIAGWYVALRDLTVIGLLCVLVYIGIRMVLSSISSDKAKYKSMLKDWFIALCLVVFMHYIMIFTLNISSLITDAIGTSGKNVTASLITEQMGTINAGINDVQKGEEKGFETLANVLILGFLAVLTVMYLVKYLMRAITIIFLVLLAPITCITYPIDKVGDRKIASI